MSSASDIIRVCRGFHAVFGEDFVKNRLLAVAIVALLAARPSAGGQGPAPTLQGAWQQERQSAMLIATKSYIAFFGVESLPALATYTIDGGRITLQPAAAGRSFDDAILEDDLGIKAPRASASVVLDRFEMNADTIRFITPDGITRAWRRLE
jgi:hypothetical protein